MENLHVLSVLVENHAGVLSRISGLFTRRAYNIDSLSVGETENPEISRMTIATRTDVETLEQIKNQLLKLVDVLEISELHRDDAVLREHVLIKVKPSSKTEIMAVADVFRAKIVDISKENLTAELTGSPSKISAFIEVMKEHDIISLVRTGISGLERG